MAPSVNGVKHDIFPPDFFYDAALFCALATAGLAMILGGDEWVVLSGYQKKG